MRGTCEESTSASGHAHIKDFHIFRHQTPVDLHIVDIVGEGKHQVLDGIARCWLIGASVERSMLMDVEDQHFIDINDTQVVEVMIVPKTIAFSSEIERFIDRLISTVKTLILAL